MSRLRSAGFVILWPSGRVSTWPLGLAQPKLVVRDDRRRCPRPKLGNQLTGWGSCRRNARTPARDARAALESEAQLESGRRGNSHGPAEITLDPDFPASSTLTV